jgi:predicted AAA+ superfamily ATPase
MYRTAIEELKEWKLEKNKKPLIVQGARQVGKTWLIQEFGKTEFKQMVYINFEHETELQSLFIRNLDTSRIITTLEAF